MAKKEGNGSDSFWDTCCCQSKNTSEDHEMYNSQQESLMKPMNSLTSPHHSDEAGPSPEEEAAEDAKVRNMRVKARRAGVAAESVSQEKIADYKKPVHQKPQDVCDKIRSVLTENANTQVLFGHMSGQPLDDVINAFYTMEATQDATIIKQGDNGDRLYIVYGGIVDIFVARPGPGGVLAENNRGTKVVTLGSGALFGELALMYNAPRAATVIAASPTVNLGVLDATDFKMLLAQSTQAQYQKYEGWLSGVDLLKTLNHYELSKLADSLESDCFDSGDVIIRQGEIGDKFFILEDGTAAAFISGDFGEKQVKEYNKIGDYFGEIALLTEAPRKATVRATGQGCATVSLSKEHFNNLLGPINDILKKDVSKYPQYADFIQ